MKSTLYIAACCMALIVGQAHAQSLKLDAPAIVLDGIPFTATVTVLDVHGNVDSTWNGEAILTGALPEGTSGKRTSLQIVNGSAKVSGLEAHAERITVAAADMQAAQSISILPGILSILPPLLAIILALTIRQVVVSLFAGIWLGAVFVYGYDVFGGFLRVLDHYIIQALSNPDHAAIIAFSMLFGGMVGVISKNGGTGGIARAFVSKAGTPRRAQLATWLLGIFIFFDDYANSLIVGNTMRPVTDKLKISREKLAYLVDSTAAPVSSLVIVSTWVGYEVGLIDAALKSMDYHIQSAYLIFIETIPYRFYPILALVMGGVVVFTGKDMFSMWKAERRARTEGKLHRDGANLATDLTETTTINPAESTPLRWWNAVIPILVVVIGAMVGLYVTGLQSIEAAGIADRSLGSIIGNADSYQSLLWASLLSCVVAIFLSVGQRILTLSDALDA